jgi:hypothetical protein
MTLLSPDTEREESWGVAGSERHYRLEGGVIATSFAYHAALQILTFQNFSP